MYYFKTELHTREVRNEIISYKTKRIITRIVLFIILFNFKLIRFKHVKFHLL